MPKKKLKGTIVSDAMQKTVVVSVDRYVKHPKYKKYMKRRTDTKLTTKRKNTMSEIKL